MKNKESNFNWKLPLYGAVGFGIGCVIGGILFIIAGAIAGAIGCAALGFALKDKKKAIYLSFAGAIGFTVGSVVGFVIWNLIGDVIGIAIGGAIGGMAIGIALKDKKKALYLSFAGALGFGIGSAVGFVLLEFIENVIAGFIRLPIGSVMGGAVAGFIGLAVGGAIGGLTLGLALAYLTKDE